MTTLDATRPAGTRPLRILFLTPQAPYPPEQGTSLRNYHIVTWAARHHQVDLLTFVEAPDPDLGPLADLCRTVRTVLVPMRTKWQRLRTMLTSREPDMAWRLRDASFARALDELLAAEAYDLLQVEGIELAWYALRLRERLGRGGPRVVFDDHNAEYLLQRRAFEVDVRRPARWPAAAYSLAQWQRLARFERIACQNAAAVVAVSEPDARILEALAPGCRPVAIPNGVDTTAHRPEMRAGLVLQHPAIVFTGKMDYRPNVDAMLWFHTEVWPLVRRAAPDARLYVVGRSPHPRLAGLVADGSVVVTDYVPAVEPYLAEADVYVAPLRIGGGTRLKILQALACGLPVVSTRLGVEGIDLQDGVHAILADTPQAFAGAVLDLLAHPARAETLRRAARALAESRYDWEVLLPRLEKVYARVLRESS